MASKKRTGLGRGLSALIPSAPTSEDRDVDVFFDGSAPTGRTHADEPQTSTSIAEKADAPAPVSNERAGTTTRKSGKAAGAAKATKAGTGRKSTAPTNVTTVAPEVRADESSASTETDEETAGNLLPVPGASLRTLDPNRIVPNARQPRHDFDQDALDELIVSVREFGVLQPIVVRPLPAGDPRATEGEYELIMGERRLRATKAAGRNEVPAIVRDTDDEDMLRDALLENLHRAELNPLEEASAYRQLLDDFGCTQEELAERIGRSRPRISNTLRLLNLPVDVQRRVAAGVLSAGHARAVLSVGEHAAMMQLADRIVNEKLSVRESETAAAKLASRGGRASRSSGNKDAPGGDSLSAHLDQVGEQLGDRLNTRVKVVLRKTKGTITIDFASMTDLNRILAELGESD